MTVATAPGKIILFGEHAVVYGRPAIAAPVSQLRATAVVTPGNQPGIRLIAPDLSKDVQLAALPPDDALALAVHQVRETAKLAQLPDLTITVSSQIPIAAGLGSGAAIAAAVIRALAQFLHTPRLLTNEMVSALTYEVEKIHHGTPSGIDNTVVAYEQPVYFVRRQPQNLIEPFGVKRPLHLLVGNTGVRSNTRDVVLDVRRQWEADPATFETIFDACGQIAQAARTAIEQGDVPQVGQLMQENHAWLQKLTVSSPELDQLVDAANNAGALGAKLSGAGRGGNMIALVTPETETAVNQSLHAAGATTIHTTTIHPR
ncbi:MAG: mevalonate kinase [Anaerolineales bacterium]|nr:mevalonate kinase [Anaerolineales bacterium]